MKNVSSLQEKAINIVLAEIKSDKSDTLNTSPARDVVVQASNYTTDVYIRYERSETDDDGDVSNRVHLIRITFEGIVDYEPFRTQKFDSVKDRVHFFTTLYTIKNA